MSTNDENCTKISFASESTVGLGQEDHPEESQLDTSAAHRAFVTIAMVFTFGGCFMFLYLVSLNQNLYFVECAACRTSFFSNFYLYFLINFAYLVVCLHNFRASLPLKPDRLWLMGHPKSLGFFFAAQVLFCIGLFASQLYACSSALSSVLADLFIFQLLQYSVQFFLGLLYNSRVAKKVAPAVAPPTESAQIEIFNASFALNETKSEANYNYLQNKAAEQTFKTDFSSNTNLSHFTNSNIDTTKLGTVSADSCLNVTKFQAFRRSPRRKLNHVKELEIQM